MSDSYNPSRALASPNSRLREPCVDLTANVPDEVLLEIFDHARSEPTELDGFKRKIRPSTIAIRIAQICRRWRSVALSVPNLWTHIHLHWPRMLVRLYLKRAGPTAPLSVYLDEVALHRRRIGWDLAYRIERDSYDFEDDRDDFEGNDHNDSGGRDDGDSSDGSDDIDGSDDSEGSDDSDDNNDNNIGSDNSGEDDASVCSHDYSPVEVYKDCVIDHIQFLHITRQRFTSNEELRGCGEDVVENVQYAVLERGTPSLKTFIQTNHGLSRTRTMLEIPENCRIENLSQLALTNVNLSFRQPAKNLPHLLSLDLRFLFLENAFGASSDHALRTIISLVPNLEHLIIIDVVNSFPRGLAPIELSRLKTLTVALSYNSLPQFFNGILLPSTAEVICEPLRFRPLASDFRMASRATSGSHSYQEWTASFSTALSNAFPVFSDPLSTLSIRDPCSSDLEYECGLSDSTSSSRLTIRFRPEEGLEVLDLQNQAKFITGIIPGRSFVRRLIINPPIDMPIINELLEAPFTSASFFSLSAISSNVQMHSAFLTLALDARMFPLLSTPRPNAEVLVMLQQVLEITQKLTSLSSRRS